MIKAPHPSAGLCDPLAHPAYTNTVQWGTAGRRILRPRGSRGAVAGPAGPSSDLSEARSQTDTGSSPTNRLADPDKRGIAGSPITL